MKHAALLVIDIQRGAFDGARCPPMDAPERLLRHAHALIDAARAAARPVVFIQHLDEPGSAFETGTRHGQLHESLQPASDEPVVEKLESSAFDGTALPSLLAARGIRELVLCGLQSEFCVSNTARGALQRGYTVHLADDGHGTWPSDGRSAEQIRAEVNAALAEAGVRCASTAALSDRLRAAD